MVSKIKRTIRGILILGIIFGGVSIVLPGPVNALDYISDARNCYVIVRGTAEKNPCPNDSRIQLGKCYSLQQQGQAYRVHELNCETGATIGEPFNTNGLDAPVPVPAGGSTSTGSQKLDKWLQAVINVLSLAVGLVIVISIIIAGIQYMTAGGNASQVAAAKNRISMAVLAFILFAFTYAILQWLVPGGVFNS